MIRYRPCATMKRAIGVLAFEPFAGSTKYVTTILDVILTGLFIPLTTCKSPLNTAKETNDVATQPSGVPARLLAHTSDQISLTLPELSIATILPFLPTAII